MFPYLQQPAVTGNYSALLLNLLKLSDRTESVPFQEKLPEPFRDRLGDSCYHPSSPPGLYVQLHLPRVVGTVTPILPQIRPSCFYLPLGLTEAAGGNIAYFCSFVFEMSFSLWKNSLRKKGIFFYFLLQD